MSDMLKAPVPPTLEKSGSGQAGFREMFQGELKALEQRAQKQIDAINDTVAKMKRTYEDILYNLDDDNFSTVLRKEKDGMKAGITINEKRIALEVIDRTNGDQTLQSLIELLAGSITMHVSKQFGEDSIQQYYNDAFPYYPPEGSDKELLWENTYFGETEGKRFYYWNDIMNNWSYSASSTVESLFIQTPDGFKLSGQVSISGDLITEGAITGITVGTIRNEFSDGIVLNSENQQLEFYHTGARVGVCFPNAGQFNIGATGSSTLYLSGNIINLVGNAQVNGKPIATKEWVAELLSEILS